MVDPKRVELTGYNGIPHLVSPVVVDLERIVGVLKWVTREMEERYKKFSAAGARNISDFNSRLKGHEPRLPYLVVIVDELADLMMLAPDETEKVLTRLAQMARATGIHLIISTQRPSVDVVTGLIKANFPARISFAVASSVDSRVVLDQPGAEKLLGRGDMLFQSPDAAAPLRMQGVFVSDAAINRITAYWKGLKIDPADSTGKEPVSALSTSPDFNRPADPVQSRTERFNPFSSKPSGTAAPNPSTPTPARPANGDDDEMYEEALEMVRKAGRPSISLLQRRLRINYTRAGRLIELMEKRGAISSAESAAARNASGDTSDPDESETEQ
jgi:S-DNA-T family DNA segregation ATPase FtsK/SpoIIIE